MISHFCLQVDYNSVTYEPYKMVNNTFLKEVLDSDEDRCYIIHLYSVKWSYRSKQSDQPRQDDTVGYCTWYLLQESKCRLRSRDWITDAKKITIGLDPGQSYIQIIINLFHSYCVLTFFFLLMFYNNL